MINAMEFLERIFLKKIRCQDKLAAESSIFISNVLKIRRAADVLPLLFLDTLF